MLELLLSVPLIVGSDQSVGYGWGMEYAGLETANSLYDPLRIQGNYKKL